VPDAKVALVTGGNKGLGFAVAQQLGERGAAVLLGARDELRGRHAAATLAARGVPVTPLRIDVTDGASIASAASEIGRRFGRLDILVNNAGIAGRSAGPPSTVTPELLREIYETNVVGVVAVTNAMLPLLRQSAAGRIVNMSSHVGSLTLTSDPRSELWHVNLLAYQSAKTALNAITVGYAKELWDTNIKVNAANPGLTATDLNQHRGHRTPEQGAVIAVELATLGPDGPTGTSQDEHGMVPW
jgi:NAD(P)-dependent dehydrogenase (short-subunit alcohol dehydrogenase family)